MSPVGIATIESPSSQGGGGRAMLLMRSGLSGRARRQNEEKAKDQVGGQPLLAMRFWTLPSS